MCKYVLSVYIPQQFFISKIHRPKKPYQETLRFGGHTTSSGKVCNLHEDPKKMVDSEMFWTPIIKTCDVSFGENHGLGVLPFKNPTCEFGHPIACGIVFALELRSKIRIQGSSVLRQLVFT